MPEQPGLTDLIRFWLSEHAPNWVVQLHEWPKGAVAALHFKGFGPQVTIYEDKVIFDSVNDKRPLEVMAANPRLFDLLSNRLYILEQGFQKALESRAETSKREHGDFYDAES
jgi:hypothetical protein